MPNADADFNFNFALITSETVVCVSPPSKSKYGTSPFYRPRDVFSFTLSDIKNFVATAQ